MALQPETKRTLTGLAAGVVAVVLTLLCVKQCNDKNVAREERDAAMEDAFTAETRAQENAIALEDLRDSLANSRSAVDTLTKQNRALADSLADCRKQNQNDGVKPCVPCKAKAAKAKSKPAKTKPATTKPAATKPATTPCKPATTKPATTATGATTTNVTLGCGAHDNTFNVNNGVVNNFYGVVDTVKTCAAATQTVVITRHITYSRQK